MFRNGLVALVFLGFVMFPAGCIEAGATDLPEATGVKPVELFRLPEPCEGIMFGYPRGQLNGYVSSGKRIVRFTPDGRYEVCNTAWAPAGIVQARHGGLVFVDADRKAVLWMGTEQHEPMTTGSKDRPFRGPRGLAQDLLRGGDSVLSNDGTYIGDPGGSSADRPTGAVYYQDGRGTTRVVADGLAYPDGVALSADGKTLYVAERDRNRILAYPVEVPGKLGPRAVFADLPKKDPAKGQAGNRPCGLCLDAAGNLYVAHRGMGRIQVLDPRGKLLRSYDAGLLWPTGVAFGGPDLDQLFVCGATGPEQDGGAVFRLDLGVEGLDLLQDTF